MDAMQVDLSDFLAMCELLLQHPHGTHLFVARPLHASNSTTVPLVAQLGSSSSSSSNSSSSSRRRRRGGGGGRGRGRERGAMCLDVPLDGMKPREAHALALVTSFAAGGTNEGKEEEDLIKPSHCLLILKRREDAKKSWLHFRL